MKLITIFDLDGVLVDNLEYERAVTEQIVRAISTCQTLSFEQAFAKWNETLAAHAKDPRWHDYSLHCAALGVPDVWRSSHLAMRHLIRQTPRAAEAIDVGRQFGACWLASDATSWVATFKLEMAGLDQRNFDEIFTLDRCGVSKGHDAFWKSIAACMDELHAPAIYVDNRLDRLMVATTILPNCRLVHVSADDHPTSLQLFPEPASIEHVRVRGTTHQDLPEALDEIARELLAAPERAD